MRNSGGGFTGAPYEKVMAFVAVLPYSRLFYAEGLVKCDSMN